MVRVVIVYFSGYGHTRKLAEAIGEGVQRVEKTDLSILAIDQEGNLSESDWETLHSATAMIYGSPTYMGGPAWQFKKFADATSKPWFSERWKDKIAAGFTNSASTNGDKYATMAYFWTLSQQHGQIWVGTGLLPANTKADGPESINWTAGFGGVMSISPVDATPEEAPRNGDLETGRLLGERVAKMAQRFS